ncbi:MAG TPA: hypothetical protein VFL56_02405 [Solirubrobacterales bacterium]|nr:hypothetical protein [Solirubrobacterales bacterium]
MALTDEQRAMLQLLLEGGQGYDDIGSLLGIGPDEVRSRARAALREMGGADPDADVALSDYLLGQADPIGRADAVRHLQSDPEANAIADRLVQQLRLIAPKASLPEIPAPRGGRRAAPAAPPSVPAAPSPAPAAPTPPPAAKGPGIATRVAGALSGLGRSSDKRRRTEITVAAAAGLALVIVAIVLLTGSGDDGGGDCTPVDTSQAEQAGIPTIKLVATGAAAEADCEPTGQITLSSVQPQQNQQQQNQQPQFALQINAANLEPTGEGEAYLLWLYTSDQEAFPLGQQTVTEEGNLTGAVPLNSAQILLLTAFESVRLAPATQAEVQQVEQAVQAAGQAKNATGVVPFVGVPALEGPVAELGLDQLLQQAQQGAGAGGGQGAAPPGAQGSGSQ